MANGEGCLVLEGESPPPPQTKAAHWNFHSASCRPHYSLTLYGVKLSFENNIVYPHLCYFSIFPIFNSTIPRHKN